MRKSIRKFFGVSLCVAAVSVFCIFFFAGCAPSYSKNRQINLKDGTWEQTFGDEFDNEVLFNKNWKRQDSLRRAALNTSSSQNVFLNGNGHLVLRTSYDHTAYGGVWRTGYLSTARVSNSDATWKAAENYEGFNQTYGYFEVRCIAPPTVGIWSAFWMMPDDGGIAFTEDDIQGTGTDGVEVDIMESPYMYQNKPNLVTHVIHGDGYGDDRLKSDKSEDFFVPGMYKKFHTYGVEWNEEEYIFYIDGYETYRTKYVVDEVQLNPSRVDQHLKLTVEVGGDNWVDDSGNVVISEGKLKDGSGFWCGDASVNDKTKNYDFIVDYVRAYKKKA